jgi:hypothetical protein
MITRECFVNLTEDNQLYEIFSKIKGGGEEGWQRPSDWLPLPDISSTEGISGLYAVWNTDSNFLAFTILGAYDVDWGDGNSGSYASGATAEHIYDWNDLSSSTLTTKGYRQAIVTITPASGDALTSIDFNVKHSTVGLASGATTGWLDVEVNAPSCTSSGLFSGSAVFHRLLEQATIHAWGGTSFNLMFNECASLQNPLLYNTNNVTNFSSMFRRCRALQTIPLFDTSSGTNFSGMFLSCESLQTIPLFDTSSGTNFSGMFSLCGALQTIPLFDTSSGTNFSSMFGGCFSLRIIPAFNFGGAAGSFDLIFIVSQINSLFKIEVTGVKTNFDISNQLLSSAALNEIYTNLADLTALPAQTITVTGNYGTAGDNPTIATAKNWTVTG